MTSSTLENRVSRLRQEADDWIDVREQVGLLDHEFALDQPTPADESDRQLVVPVFHFKESQKERNLGRFLGKDIRKHLGTFNDWHLLTVQGSAEASQVVRHSVEVLGIRITAYLCRLESDRKLQDWSKGVDLPPPLSLERLRLATRTATIIEEWDGREVARSWLVGRNRFLDDSPLQLIRDAEPADVGPRIVAAARAFIAGG